MAYIFGYNLTDYKVSMMENIYIYRGMTALQLVVLMYGKGYTEGEEKSVYNHLRNRRRTPTIFPLTGLLHPYIS